MVSAGSGVRARAGRVPMAMVAALAAIVVGAIITLAGRSTAGLVRAGTEQQVRDAGVVFVPDARAFVVADGSDFLGLSAISPHLGHPILFCRTSGWFEDPYHGEKFDGLGVYLFGPAPRGMDRVAVSVRSGVVYVDPSKVTTGPPRGTPHTNPSGPLCSQTARGGFDRTTGFWPPG